MQIVKDRRYDMNNLQHNKRFWKDATFSGGIVGGLVDSVLLIPHPNYYPPVYGGGVDIYPEVYPYGGGYYFF